MDLVAFQDSRQTDLQNFQTQYAQLKSEYSTAVTAAIQEPDTTAQNNLIQRVLALNQNMTEQIRGILGILGKGTTDIDTATMNSLTEDLVKYQRQYGDLKQSMDKLQTLKMIQTTTQSNLAMAMTAYNVYLFALCILCLAVIMLAIRAAWTTSLVSTVQQGITQAAGGR
jgi:beta-lactamase class A